MDQHRDDEDAGEEETPDWQLLSKFIKSTKTTGPSVEAFIPRRGEKDFEPIEAHAGAQSKALAKSREALFTALSAGIRGHSSKDHVRCIWGGTNSPSNQSAPGESTQVLTTNASSKFVPAYVDGIAKGVLFSSIGRWNREKKRLDLMPEELLYLIERGTVECWTEDTEETGHGGLPMSVQWAWTEIIGTGGLTLKRYQVYGYLKRLGYIVLRKEHVDSLWSLQPNQSQTTLSVSCCMRPWMILSTARDYILTFLFQLRQSICFWSPYKTSNKVLTEAGASCSLIRPGVWRSYDSIFRALRIFPSGPKVPNPPILRPKMSSREREEYEVFYYVYKPNNRFPKTAPPKPDFEVCVVNAETMPIPTISVISELLSTTHPANQPPQNPSTTSTSKSWSFASFFLYGPLSLFQSTTSKNTNSRRPNIFAKLKKGERNVLLAVVDHGVTTFLRVAETDFGGTPLVGGHNAHLK
ncbi:hypothetical protein DFH28DRAFT_895417 [Melampsora americana]|nr:hypothetical protein DFH28DRAFT_895417 [Melampsora americana]